MEPKPTQDVLLFFCNGRKILEPNPDPRMTLNTYLRYKLFLPGTKQSCGEGGCGACTAMLSYYDGKTKTIRHMAVNTCLMPVCSVHHMAVTTVEGIGSTKSKLHPVQERIAKAHGSQCGFCTPGFVMSMYALLRNNPQPAMDEVEAALLGNLCRCTGYRPILEGFKTFTKECCGDTNEQGCCQMQLSVEEENLGLSNKLFRSQEWEPYDSTQDAIFPPELQLLAEKGTEGVAFSGHGATWFRPINLQGLFHVKLTHPESKIISGNTSIGFDVRYKNCDYSTILCTSHVVELLQLELVENGVFIGSSVTLASLQDFLKEQTKVLPEAKTRFFSVLLDLLDIFSGVQIRNVASVGGNLLADRPNSDLKPVFMAVGCSLQIASATATRSVPFDAFYSEDGRPSLGSDEILVGILLPFSEENDYMFSFKQSTRKGNDAAIVNAAMRVQFDGSSDVIEDIMLVYGGLPSALKVAEKTKMKLKGRKWDSSIVDDGCVHLLEDLSLPYGTPGGMEKYKQSLALSFFFKFYLKVTELISKKAPAGGDLGIPSEWKSAVEKREEVSFQSTQLFQDVVDGQPAIDPVGRPKPVKSSLEHATGEARYVDDIPPAINELFLAIVRIKSPHAKIISVDFSKALEMDEVVGVVTSDDVPGVNFVEFFGEYVFAVDEVIFPGQPIAAVLAVNEEKARRAAKLVKVDYQDLEFILTIDEALEKKSYFAYHQGFDVGDVDGAFTNSDHVISGEMRVGMQDHFYLETQTALVKPGGEHGEFEVIAASQDLHGMQGSESMEPCSGLTSKMYVYPSYHIYHLLAAEFLAINHKPGRILMSDVLNVPSNRIVCRTKRVGGAFGNKGATASFHACRTAVAANKFNRPVRAVLDRHEDMISTGQRASYLAKYKVGFSKEGKLQALDVEVCTNWGCSPVLADYLMNVVLYNIDNVYRYPNFRGRGKICKTNVPVGVPMRATGVAASVAIQETVISHVATAVQLPEEKIRELNFYKPTDVTHMGVSLQDWTLSRCWELALQRSDFTARKVAVENFNKANRWIKRGLSIAPGKFPIGMPKVDAKSSALVHIYTDGAVLITHGGIEMGQGLHTKMLQIASRTLRIPVDKIHCAENSTNTVANSAVTHGSIGTDYNGPAVKDACETLLHRLEPYMMENPKGSWEDWVTAADKDRVCLSATGHFATPEEQYTYSPGLGDYLPGVYHSYGAAVSEVEVDCLTGGHRLIRTDIVMDVGDSINPAVDIGQVEGAFIQAYGLYVLEDYRYSPSGELLTVGPGGYKVPLCTSVPSVFNVSLLHSSPNPRAICSSKAVGEPPFLLATSVLMAIKSAISSARADEGLSGYFPLFTPAVPERIRMACQDKFTTKIPDPEETDQPSIIRP